MTQRMEKVNKRARQVLGEAIQGLKDPRIGFVTVTAVHISPDLRHARVTVSVLGDADAQAVSMAGIESAKAHLRGELGHKLVLKFLPELNFELDQSDAKAERIEMLLKEIHGKVYTDAPTAPDGDASVDG